MESLRPNTNKLKQLCSGNGVHRERQACLRGQEQNLYTCNNSGMLYHSPEPKQTNLGHIMKPKKSLVKHNTKWGKLKAFPLKSGAIQMHLPSLLLFNTVLRHRYSSKLRKTRGAAGAVTQQQSVCIHEALGSIISIIKKERERKREKERGANKKEKVPRIPTPKLHNPHIRTQKLQQAT